MSPVKLTVHRLESSGVCSLTNKEGEVLLVSFDDGTLTESALSQKSLMQLLRMKLQQNGKSQGRAIPTAKPVEVK